MRLFRILLLHFEEAIEYKSTSFVWFLITILNPLILLCYWFAYYKSNNVNLFTFDGIVTYYFFLMIATNFLMSYVEYAIAEHDIQRGYLAQLLLKPFPYLLYRFFAEIPWRTIRGVIGIITVVIISVIFSGVINIGISVGNILPIIVVSILAYILSFLFKSTASLLNFWLTDFTGFMNLIEIVVLIGAGYLMPIDLMPTKFGTYINSTPFPYMIYYPVRVMMGDYSLSQTFLVIAKQFFWIVLFYILFLLLWNKGLKKFTGVGL